MSAFFPSSHPVLAPQIRFTISDALQIILCVCVHDLVPEKDEQ